jgi:acyl dehydratase
MGRYMEDWVVGEEFETANRTITETDVVMFAALSGDYNLLHTSIEDTKNNNFGQRVVHGLLGLAISHGLLFRTGYLEPTAIAFLGMESWQFKAPIFFGDTIKVKARVVETRPTRKPGRGVVKFFLELVKQDGTVVQDGYKTLMFKSRENSAQSFS